MIDAAAVARSIRPTQIATRGDLDVEDVRIHAIDKGVTYMNIAVAGGTGLIGSQVVKILQAAGHGAVPLSPSTGVDLLTGEGLDAALEGADVVVNLTNSRTF